MAHETLVLDRAVLLWAQMRGGLCPDRQVNEICSLTRGM